MKKVSEKTTNYLEKNLNEIKSNVLLSSSSEEILPTFGTNGVRGLFSELTPHYALKLAQAFGIWIKNRYGNKIIVARDQRITSECLASAVKSGLLSVGCEVYDVGLCSSPGAEYMLNHLKASGLIIVTASHNPPEYNALKFIDGNGVTISKERGKEIINLIPRIELAKIEEIKPIQYITNAESYHFGKILRNLNYERLRQYKNKIKVAADFGNGTSALYEKFLSDFAVIYPLNKELDGLFRGRKSEPTPENLQKLSEYVKKYGLMAGFAWDGDADRFVMIDEHGNYIFGDKVVALSTLFKIKIKNEKIKKAIITVSTGRVVEDIVKKHGGEVIYTKVGAPYLSEEMLNQKAQIAGEEVGGVIWPEVSLAKDGIMTSFAIIEMLTYKPLSEWLNELPEYYNVKNKVYIPTNEMKNLIIEEIKERLKNENIITIDGIRINFEDSWVIIRASGTEPYIRIFAEAKTKEKAKELAEKYTEMVSKLANSSL